MKMFTLLQSAEVVEVAATEANDAVQAIAEQPAEPASAEAPVKPAGGGMSMWVMLALHDPPTEEAAEGAPELPRFTQEW